MRRLLGTAAVGTMLLAACAAPDQDGGSISPVDAVDASDVDADDATDEDGEGAEVTDLDVVEQDRFESPWALEFLPGTDHLLVTERGGALQLRDQSSGEVREVSGTPEVDAAGQGGLHDVIAGPTFSDDGTIFLSWVREAASGGSQGVVARATLDVDAARLGEPEILWEQDAASGDGHFSLRLLVHDDLLHITSGDRQELDPAQDDSTNLGTVVRLTLDGDPAPDNPFADAGGTTAQLWTTGHRNPLGIAVDSAGEIWNSEMGPEGGDELNLLVPGANYGWPEVSMGVHYGGEEIPDHAEGDGFEAPKAFWVPAISPGNLMIYSGELFTGWQDSALLGGLSGQNLVRVQLEGGQAEQVAEWDMGDRVRAVEQAPDGAIWIATDSGVLSEIRPG